MAAREGGHFNSGSLADHSVHSVNRGSIASHEVRDGGIHKPLLIQDSLSGKGVRYNFNCEMPSTTIDLDLRSGNGVLDALLDLFLYCYGCSFRLC